MSDNETNPTLRKLRNKLGYGIGWTFKEALWDKVGPWVLAIPLWVFLIWFMSHTRVVWIP